MDGSLHPSHGETPNRNGGIAIPKAKKKVFVELKRRRMKFPFRITRRFCRFGDFFLRGVRFRVRFRVRKRAEPILSFRVWTFRGREIIESLAISLTI